MGNLPYGRNDGEPISSKKELGEFLLGVGVLFGVLAIFLLLVMLFAKGYKTQKELILIAGIPGAIGLLLIALGIIFRRMKSPSIFANRPERRK